MSTTFPPPTLEPRSRRDNSHAALIVRGATVAVSMLLTAFYFKEASSTNLFDGLEAGYTLGREAPLGIVLLLLGVAIALVSATSRSFKALTWMTACGAAILLWMLFANLMMITNDTALACENYIFEHGVTTGDGAFCVGSVIPHIGFVVAAAELVYGFVMSVRQYNSK